MIPAIDPSVKFRGTSSLREFNSETLRALEGAIVIQGPDLEPLVVIVPYETYLRLQETALDNLEVRKTDESPKSDGSTPPASSRPFKGPLPKPKDKLKERK